MVVLLHEVDDNVAVVARIVASITLHYITEHNRNCPVSGKIMPAEVAGSSWGSVCILAERVCGTSGAVGVAPAPVAAVAGVFQLPSHCEPPQTTVRECCKCKQRVSQRKHRERY